MDGQVNGKGTQQPPRDLEFWDSVDCAKCHLLFAPERGPSPPVPFWLTECGHILCNSHLTADRSCPICNAQGIELVPLQKEMPPPMSDWFCPIPFKLDALAQAAKFQQESLLASVRYYRNRCDQYRTLLDHIKKEIAAAKELKKENESLKQEIALLRGSWSGHQQANHHQQEPSQYVNGNGKRRMVDSRLSTSSPRSIHTPLGPPRITLPPDQEPTLTFLRTRGGSDSSSGNRNGYPSHSRGAQEPLPAIQQYAYNPPQTPQMHVQSSHVLSHAQQAPLRQAAGRTSTNQHNAGLMLPPPTPAYARQQQAMRMAGPRPVATPIPTEAYGAQASSRPSAFLPQQGGHLTQMLDQGSRRFVSPSAAGGRFIPPTPAGAPQRFVPSTPSTSRRT